MQLPAQLSAFDAYVADTLGASASEPARHIGERLSDEFPGAAVFLYGSGISVSASDDPSSVMFDFYVIAPDYRSCFSSAFERAAARLLPPNVFYFEVASPWGVLRSKYAVLSIDHLEKLVSKKTFHSYFWARFAQPMRLVAAPDRLRARAMGAVRSAIETFYARSRALVGADADWRSVWLAGLRASYRSELRAENRGRAELLLEHIAGWAETAARFVSEEKQMAGGINRASRTRAVLAWRLRAVQGAVLSAARLLKATATFDGGIEYIAWKIERHTGIDVRLKEWERRHPLIAAPVVALRYFRLRARALET